MADDARDTLSRGWTDGYWWSNDGIRLHYRDYAAPQGAPAKLPLLCLPALTRNARDFHALACHVQASGRRVVSVDFRGRGESGYAKDPLSYVPLTYVQDLAALFDDATLDRFVVCGTSLGGIVAMLLAGSAGERLAGAILNDVGPVLEAEGLARIRSYVGQGGSEPTWVHAARAAEERHKAVYPGWRLQDWLAFVKRTHRLTSEGRIVADYDSKIAEPFRVLDREAAVDLWPAYEALAGEPVLVIRGSDSDVLGAATAEAMIEREPGAQLVTIEGTGHAPTLMEPEAIAAIDALLAKADAVSRAPS